MKHNFFKVLCAGGVIALALGSCTKATNNTYYGNGTKPVFSASVTSVAVTPADSLSNVVVLSWTDPKYPGTYPGPNLYTIQVDSVGHNFVTPAVWTVSGGLLDTLQAKTVNSLALSMGGAFGVPFALELRVVSSYANNNAPLTSNTLNITVTPYKTPPKVQPPTTGQLFLVGSATMDSWNNPVPSPAQQFTVVDSVHYTGNFYLQAGEAYDMLPANGSWNNKYNVPSGVASPPLGVPTSFQYVTGGGEDIPAPTDSNGIYNIWVDFQVGTFTVTKVQGYANLWIPGNYQGWAPATAPMLASVNKDGLYDGFFNYTELGGFKFTGEADWNGVIIGDTAKAGGSDILTTANGGGNNIEMSGTGWWYMKVDTKMDTFFRYPITQFGLIGDFNSWSTDVVMTYNAGSNGVPYWTGTFTAAASGGFKIRADGAWDFSWGIGGPGGSMSSTAANNNIPVTAGTHTVTFYITTAGYYNYTIQ